MFTVRSEEAEARRGRVGWSERCQHRSRWAGIFAICVNSPMSALRDVMEVGYLSLGFDIEVDSKIAKPWKDLQRKFLLVCHLSYHEEIIYSNLMLCWANVYLSL